jgi:large subunit ribosomal protein L21
MTYAIIETGGKQIRVEPGRFYDVDRLTVGEDEQITLERVLFVSNDGEAHVGQPLVEGATITATVMRHLRGRKVIVYKMKPKKKTRKKRGHRQELTRVMVDAINLNGQALSGSTASTPTKADTAPATAGAGEEE